VALLSFLLPLSHEEPFFFPLPLFLSCLVAVTLSRYRVGHKGYFFPLSLPAGFIFFFFFLLFFPPSTPPARHGGRQSDAGCRVRDSRPPFPLPAIQGHFVDTNRRSSESYNVDINGIFPPSPPLSPLFFLARFFSSLLSLVAVRTADGRDIEQTKGRQ